MTFSNQFWYVCGILFIFGFGYNWFVDWLERKGYERGYTSILVVGGTLIVIVGFGYLEGIEAAVRLTILFGFAGFWMVVGSIHRHVRVRNEEENINVVKQMINDRQ